MIDLNQLIFPVDFVADLRYNGESNRERDRLMRLDDDQMLLIVMALITIPENDYRMNQLRQGFYKADKPHTEFDIEAEYRFQSANAITARWLKARAGRV